MEGPFQLVESVIDTVVTKATPAVFLIRRVGNHVNGAGGNLISIVVMLGETTTGERHPLVYGDLEIA